MIACFECGWVHPLGHPCACPPNSNCECCITVKTPPTSFPQIDLTWECNSPDCEWCTPEKVSHLPESATLTCHCGWMHSDNSHNPDWIEWMGQKPSEVDEEGHNDCSSIGGPKAKDCDCGWCVSSREALIAYGWGTTWN